MHARTGTADFRPDVSTIAQAFVHGFTIGS